MTPELRERHLGFQGPPEFPSGLYFDVLDILEMVGYEVRKADDWLEINPHSDYYQDLVQKKERLQRQVSTVIDKISQFRKDLEMLRHDKRKLDRIIQHKEGGDLDVLKSDFVDLVDRNTEMSLLDLANSGRFPSVVVDFYKIEDEEDIDKMEVSKGEKEVLRKKWKLFKDWLGRYVKEIKKRKQMVEAEIQNKKTSIEYYKDMLHPYAKALRRIKFTEPEEYKGFDDPRIVERYSSSVAGIELYAWKPIRIEAPQEREEFPAGVEKREFFCFLDISVKKRSRRVGGRDVDTLVFEIGPELRHRSGIEEAKEDIKEKEREILQSIGKVKGEIFEEEVETEEEEEGGSLQRISESLEGSLRKLLGKPRAGELRGEQRDALEEVVEEEVDNVYVKIKRAAGALELKKLR